MLTFDNLKFQRIWWLLYWSIGLLPIHIQSEKSNIQSENIVHNDTYSVEGPLALLIYTRTVDPPTHKTNIALEVTQSIKI